MGEEQIHEDKEGTREHRLGGRLVGFVRRRPIVSLGLLAGVGALSGVEWAAGALLGLGAAAMLTTRAGSDLRERARHFFEHTEGGGRHQPT